MPDATTNNRARLLEILKTQSIFFGDFTLASGAKSKVYFDCRLTTLDPEGACLVGEGMYELIRSEAGRLGVAVDAVGGLTMGADPIAVAIGMTSWKKSPADAYQIYTVRKAAKEHGKTKLIEGNFKAGMNVVVIDDVVTKGDSTLKAIDAVKDGGGNVAFVAVFVDREEGGCDKIRAFGYPVVALFKRTELIPAEA